MSVSQTSASINPGTPLLSNNQHREEDILRRIRSCYRFMKFGRWLPFLGSVTTSLYVRVSKCNGLSNDACVDNNSYLVPVEMLGVIAGSVLIIEKIAECRSRQPNAEVV